MAIRISELADAINECLAEYTDEVEEALEETKKRLADEAVKELKATSPRRPKGGKYAKGWRAKRVGRKYVVHNKRYQITHLLEKGHAKKGGGRVAARVHIKPVENSIYQKAVAKFEAVMK